MLKYWDLDRFEMLLEMPGHHAEVWALALSTYGDYIVTGEVLKASGLLSTLYVFTAAGCQCVCVGQGSQHCAWWHSNSFSRHAS
jgi:WD40 repeat protein